MKNLTRNLALLLITFTIGVSGCGGDPGEEGGLIGTGIIGTVSVNKTLATESVAIKASSGEIVNATLNRNRRYTAADLTGAAPYLVRSDLGNGEYLYSIAYSKGTVSNVHSYSDVILRLWFEANNQSIDSAYSSNAPLQSLPSEQEFNQLSEQVFSIVRLVMQSYNVSGEQLLNAEYNADNRGIDEYLDNNPVVIEGREISIILTDPTNDIQTSTKAGFTLGAIPQSVGPSSPGRVGNVKALGSTLSEIVVVWDPALDDIGVIGYQVLRDSNIIATTPYPVYTDTGLQAGVSYSYEIIAIDGDGNFSVASVPIEGSTLSGVDTLAPPTPTRVSTVESSPNKIVLQWSQANIADVVAFNIYRGAPGGTVELLIKSTSTEVTDLSVSGGTNYCYRIEALDASGNKSELSDLYCVSTTGEMVGASGGVGNTGYVTDLAIPDPDAINCTLVLQASITEDTVLNQPCYLVNDNVEIQGFADVVVSAGTVFRFAQNVGLDVGTNASFAVRGSPQSPVMFTGQEDVVGFWRGIRFDRSFNEDNQIVNAVIEYAGSESSGAALLVDSFANRPTRLRVQGSLFRYNKWAGVDITGLDARIDLFEGNVLTENRIPASISPLVLPSISPNNDMTGNRFDHLSVPRLLVTTDLIIPNLGVPLSYYGIEMDRANLTIDAGVEIIFGPGLALTVENGNLTINGTVDNPVLLTSNDKTPGDWGGVHLINSTDSRLEGVVIEYGGESVARYNANLSLENSTASLKNVSVNESAGYGIFADQNSRVNDLGGVQQNNNVLQ